MDYFLSDEEIESLITERKTVAIPLSRIGSQFKEKRGHKEYDLVIPRGADGDFHIKIRQSLDNPLAFSVILAYAPTGRSEWFILRRYNGKNHRHGNRLEREPPFYDFHIHMATARYQIEGMNEETYAEVTDRYSDLNGAITCLIGDCRIFSMTDQADLFE